VRVPDPVAVPLSLKPTDTDVLAAAKAKILDAGNITAPFALSARALREDSDLLVALRVLVSTTNEIRDYAKAFQGQAISEKNERRWRVLLRKQAVALLRERTALTTAAEDAALLASLPADAPGRMVTAVTTRLGEKQVLAKVLEELERKQLEPESVATGSSERVAVSVSEVTGQ